MTTHGCPGGCGRQVPYHHFSCRNCWYRLPPDLRRPISANYQRDDAAHNCSAPATTGPTARRGFCATSGTHP